MVTIPISNGKKNIFSLSDKDYYYFLVYHSGAYCNILQTKDSRKCITRVN